MVQTSTNDPHQLTTRIDRLGVWPLVIAPIPLLRTSLHLSHIVRSQGQALETMMSGHRPGGDKVVQRQTIKGTERTPRTLDSLIDCLGRRISPPRIIAGATGVLDVVVALEPLEALRPGIVDVLSIGDELRRRRGSVGSRHFEWRTGWWFKGQRLTLLLSAHDRHALLWSSLSLPRDSSVRQPDKPRIFFIHSGPKLFGVWCYFYLHLTHLCSIFVTPLSSNPLLSPIAPLWFPVNPLIRRDTESSYSFYSYLPLCLLLGYGLCAGPALNMYVYKRLVSAIGIPRLDINLDLSTACLLYSNLRVVLVDNSLHPISISCSCVCSRYLGENQHAGFRSLIPISSYWVFVALRRKLVQYERVLAVSLGGQGSTIPTPTWGVLVCTCQHRYGTG